MFAHGATFTYVADKIGINQWYLSNIIVGRRRPIPDVALVISQWARTSLDLWLFKSKINLELRRQASNKAYQRTRKLHEPH